MNAAELKKWLTSNYACTESLEWLSDRDLDTAWAECPRGDWLLWLTAKAGIDRKRLVMSACSTAREALRFVPEGEDRPRIAIETAEAWCRSEATIEQVREARWNAAADATTLAILAAVGFANSRSHISQSCNFNLKTSGFCSCVTAENFDNHTGAI